MNMLGVAFRGPVYNLQFVFIPIASDYLLNPNQKIGICIGYQATNVLPCPVIVRLNRVGRLIGAEQLGTSNSRHRLSTTDKYTCAGGTRRTPW